METSPPNCLSSSNINPKSPQKFLIQKQNQYHQNEKGSVSVVCKNYTSCLTAHPSYPFAKQADLDFETNSI